MQNDSLWYAICVHLCMFNFWSFWRHFFMNHILRNKKINFRRCCCHRMPLISRLLEIFLWFGICSGAETWLTVYRPLSILKRFKLWTLTKVVWHFCVAIQAKAKRFQWSRVSHSVIWCPKRWIRLVIIFVNNFKIYENTKFNNKTFLAWIPTVLNQLNGRFQARMPPDSLWYKLLVEQRVATSLSKSNSDAVAFWIWMGRNISGPSRVTEWWKCWNFEHYKSCSAFFLWGLSYDEAILMV